MNSTRSQAFKIVQEIKALDFSDSNAFELLTEKIDLLHQLGWSLAVQAYSQIRTTAQKGPNRGLPLKQPKTEWINIAHWIKSDEEPIWYYNNKADNKQQAQDMAFQSELK